MFNHFVIVLGVIIFFDDDDDDDDDDDYVRNNHRYYSDYSSNDVNDSNMKIFEYILCKNIHTTVFGFSTQI